MSCGTDLCTRRSICDSRPSPTLAVTDGQTRFRSSAAWPLEPVVIAGFAPPVCLLGYPVISQDSQWHVQDSISVHTRRPFQSVEDTRCRAESELPIPLSWPSVLGDTVVSVVIERWYLIIIISNSYKALFFEPELNSNHCAILKHLMTKNNNINIHFKTNRISNIVVWLQLSPIKQ